MWPIDLYLIQECALTEFEARLSVSFNKYWRHSGDRVDSGFDGWVRRGKIQETILLNNIQRGPKALWEVILIIQHIQITSIYTLFNREIYIFLAYLVTLLEQAVLIASTAVVRLMRQLNFQGTWKCKQENGNWCVESLNNWRQIWTGAVHLKSNIFNTFLSNTSNVIITFKTSKLHSLV